MSNMCLIFDKVSRVESQTVISSLYYVFWRDIKDMLFAMIKMVIASREWIDPHNHWVFTQFLAYLNIIVYWK